MVHGYAIFAEAFQWLTLPHLSRSWSLVIWGGLVALTISLLILTRTRWGQSKPISKCIAMSVFAHLVILVYAYCTHLWTAPPTLAVHDTFQIKIVSESDIQGDPEATPEVTTPASLAESQPSTLEPQPSGEELTETDPQEPLPVEASITDEPESEPEPLEEPVEEPLEEPLTEEDPVPDDPPVAETAEPLETTAIESQLPEIVSDTQPADLVTGAESSVTVTDLPVNDSQDPVTESPPQPVTAPSYERPKLYQYRFQAQREEMLQKYGGNARSEAAVHSALQWLARNQNDNGGWAPRVLEGGVERRIGGHDRKGAGSEADTGITGLVVLAFLGSGHTHWEGMHRQVVKRGVEYLIRKQARDGNMAGSARLFARMYCHSMATLAISEAYAMTGDPQLSPAVKRAAAYTIWAQHPRSGGWRYQPGDRGDTSQFGWQVMALRSAQFAGVEVSATTRQLNTHFLRSVLHGKAGGLASYRPLQQPSRTMTAEALVCRAFLKWPRNEAAIQEGVNFVMGELPGSGKKNFYYWYYGSLALHQVQGPQWQRWNEALQRELLGLQRQQGEQAGSWDPDTVWGAYGGRAYSTAMAALCLEVYYRYLPLYQ